jgi:hypothetical protein
VSAVQPDRPVRLTFPSYDIGAARIMAGDLQVGHVLGEYWCWRAWLWPIADDFGGALTGEQVTGKNLSAVREKLRQRVADKGPWWVLGDVTARLATDEGRNDKGASDE